MCQQPRMGTLADVPFDFTVLTPGSCTAYNREPERCSVTSTKAAWLRPAQKSEVHRENSQSHGRLALMLNAALSTLPHY